MHFQTFQHVKSTLKFLMELCLLEFYVFTFKYLIAVNPVLGVVVGEDDNVRCLLSLVMIMCRNISTG